MNLPIDIINHILSFRRTHPVALLIKENLLQHYNPNYSKILHLNNDYKQFLKWKSLNDLY